MIDRRDDAIVRLMAETGLRAGEVIGMQVADVDLRRARDRAAWERRQGPRGAVRPANRRVGRPVHAGSACAPASETGALWLGGGGQTFSYAGLNVALKRRALAAGIEGFHLHLMRHTAATRWLRAGGSEGGLMAVAGWSTRSMVDRYTGASAAERAATEARGLGLGIYEPDRLPRLGDIRGAMVDDCHRGENDPCCKRSDAQEIPDHGCIREIHR